MPELAILGDEDVVLGFGAFGFKTYAFKELAEFARALEEIADSGTGICLVQDNIYTALEEKIKSYKNLPLPIFIPFAKNLQMDLVGKIVQDIRIRATGAL